MGQKIHPLALRIQSSTRHFDHAWYSEYFFSKLLSIDLYIFQYLNNFLKLLKLTTGRFSMYHLPKTTKLYNFFCYPRQSREYKAKIFNISSGFVHSKTKKYKVSGKNLKARTVLSDSNLYSKLLQQKGKTYEKQTIQSSLYNKAFYNILKSPLFQVQDFSNNSVLKIQTDTLNISNFLKSLNIFTKIVKNSKDKKQNQFSSQILNSLKVPEFTSSKNSNAKNSLHTKNEKSQVLFFLKQFLLFSRFLKTPYSCNQQIFGIWQKEIHNNTISSEMPLLKYTSNLENSISKFSKSDIRIIPFQTHFEWQDAGYFADEIVFFLERRISFRQLKNRLLRQFSLNPAIQGVRITCSGRVGGKSKKAQRAKIECIKYGQTSLHIFSSKIDFAVRTASTPLGSTGVKVWICYK